MQSAKLQFKMQNQINIIPQIISTRPDLLQINKLLSNNLRKTKIFEEIRIVYFGTPDFSGYVLEKLIEFCQNPPQHLVSRLSSGNSKFLKFTIQAIVTANSQSPVALVAKKNGLLILEPKQLDVNFIKSHLSFLDADLYLVVAYGQILPEPLLDIPKLGAINIHPSKLPLYRGPSPIQAQILDGIADSAISFILMDEGVDHGPILYQEPYRILENDTFESLCKKMFAKSAKILPRVINDFVNNNLHPKSQNHDISSFCDLVKKEDGYFDINNPPDPKKLDRMIRAYYPWPTAWTRWNDKIVKFIPNSSLFTLYSSPFLIQIEGKKPTDLKSFLNGYPDFPVKSLW